MRNDNYRYYENVSRIRFALFIIKWTDNCFIAPIKGVIKELINVILHLIFLELIIVIRRTHTLIEDQIHTVKDNFLAAIKNEPSTGKILKEKGINKSNKNKQFYVLFKSKYKYQYGWQN